MQKSANTHAMAGGASIHMQKSANTHAMAGGASIHMQKSANTHAMASIHMQWPATWRVNTHAKVCLMVRPVKNTNSDVSEMVS